MLQTEAAECGLACLCMVASYWGHLIDIASMRRRFSVSMRGLTLRGLIAMSQGLRMQARPVRLEMAQLTGLKLPCVLHWSMNHFVVLKSVSRTHATIHDPAVGARRLTFTEVSKHFTGVALELMPTSTFEVRREVRKFSMLSLMGRVVGLRRGLLQLLTLGVVLQGLALLGPFYMQWLIDEALLAADRDLVTVLGCGFLLLVIVQTTVGAVRTWLTTILSTDLNLQWLGNTFSHLLKLPLSYFGKRHAGDIVSRFESIQTMQRSLTTQLVEGVVDGVLVLGTLVMMMLYSPSLAIIACLTVVLYIGFRWFFYRELRNATAEQIIHAAKQQTHFLESVHGVQSIRLFDRVLERQSGWVNALADQFNAQLRVSKLQVAFQVVNGLLFNAERVIIIWLAALAVLDHRFSVGMLFAFISYKEQFSQRMGGLVDKLFELRMLRLHGERVADIVLTETEQDACDAEIDPETIAPSLELRNLSFRYSDSEPNILSRLNLKIPAGQCVAITGTSGSGKTTLIKLLLGLLEPTEGEILVGGQKLSHVGLANFRRMIGTVMQEDTLFAGSISDNISFFDTSPRHARINACADLAAVGKEIASMPMGFNTLVGDIGTGLSGGQKQRILLARALYKNPRILVLDEATSHLDLDNERAVNAAIQQLELTRIIVAHRPETIIMADRVVLLEKGAIQSDTAGTCRGTRQVNEVSGHFEEA